MTGPDLEEAVEITHFTVPKPGNRARENEDSVLVEGASVALSDGASSGLFSGLWADILTSAYCETPFLSHPEEGDFDEATKRFAAWLRPLRDDWEVRSREELGDRISLYYMRRKFQAGTGATLLGMTFSPTDSGQVWDCVSVGDSCLFLRHCNGRLSFPLQGADECGNAPRLVWIKPRPERQPAAWPRQCCGLVEEGDELLLCTDALGCCLLRDGGLEGEAWQGIWEVESQGQFEDLVRRLRSQGRIEPDDVTALRMRF